MSDTSAEPPIVRAIPVRAVDPIAIIKMTPEDESRMAGFSWLIVSTLLSPACIALSFWYLTQPHSWEVFVSLLTTTVFFITLGVSIYSTSELAGGGVHIPVAGKLLDIIAGIALAVMAFIPLVFSRLDRSEGVKSNFLVAATIALGLMASATPRFIFYYRAMAVMARSFGRSGLARFATIIGFLKLIEEAVLLGSTALFAALLRSEHQDDNVIWIGVVSLLAVAGYGVVWIPTLILHLRLRSLAKNPVRAAINGFDVMMKPVEPAL